MESNVREKRKNKCQEAIKASLDHLDRCVATIQDANLYSRDAEEQVIDMVAAKLLVIRGEVAKLYREVGK